MENLAIVCQGLESPADAAFQEAMRPELQQRLLAFSEEEWDALSVEWPQRPIAWLLQLCDTLSPVKHGAPASAILLAIAQDGPLECLVFMLPKLIAHQVVQPRDREMLQQRLAQLPVPMGHHAARQHRDLQALLDDERARPSIQEACEYASDHRDFLGQSKMAACYYCQTVFGVAAISEFIDGGKTALCPNCGTDAVLPDATGYDLSAAALQALNEFWFH